MNADEIKNHVKQLEALDAHKDTRLATIRYPQSQNLWRQETLLTKRYNAIRHALAKAGVEVEGHSPKPVFEDETPPMHGFRLYSWKVVSTCAT